MTVASLRIAGMGLWAWLYALAAAKSLADAMHAKASSGIFEGHESVASSNVIEYLGIPYAKPPVGDLRFAPPEAFTSGETSEASQFGFRCPAVPYGTLSYPGIQPQAQDILSLFALFKGKGAEQSENCLTLNVWTRETKRFSSAKKPVIVFF